MPAPIWTSAQLSAINTRGKTLLVSAAAGSGKTATLTERIIRRITDDKDAVDLSRLLVVTFTKAAAADLRRKISEALSSALASDPSNTRLSSQLMLLGNARICTIDSFYYDILKSNAAKLSLPGDLRIMDDAQKLLIYRAIMEETLEHFYEEDPAFPGFADHFADVRSIDRLGNIFIDLYEQLLPYRRGVDTLSDSADSLAEGARRDFFDTPFGAVALADMDTRLGYYQNILSSAEEYFCDDPKLSEGYSPMFRHDRLCIEAVRKAISRHSYEEARALLQNYQPLRLKPVRNADDRTVRFRELRGEAKDYLKKHLEDKFFALPGEEIAMHMRTTAEVCRKAHALLSEYDRRLAREKMLRGVCDFSDIRRYVLALLVDQNDAPTALALDLRESFDEIYIDEYQDTDQVQDLIFRTIAKPDNRFLVGDIKQSIYSFRGAEPSIFAGYRRTLPPLSTADGNSASIFMSNNFRCDKNIIEFSNLISSFLFRHCGKSIEYSAEDDLIFSKRLPHEDYISPKVTVAMIANSEEQEDIDPEHEYVANEILRLCREQKKADGTPITYGDIAILVRKKKGMAPLMERLRGLGIPAVSAEQENFFENPDVLLVLSLLTTIDNPQRDIPLSGALCSPFFDFSLEELVTVRRASDASLSLYDALAAYGTQADALAQKCRTFVSDLAYWRYQAEALPVDKLLRKLYREFSVLSLSGAKENNLLRLYEYARSFEAGHFRGLYSFIRYIDQIIESGTKLAAESPGDAPDAVHIMTIHHSKGLEYPVCFLCEAASPFNTEFEKENIQFLPSVGIGFKLADASGLGFYDTPIRRAIIDQKVRLGREEEMRVLYVAMTRARERLYVTACVSDPDKLRDKARTVAEFGAAVGIINAKCFLEWILAAIEEAGEYSPMCDCLTLHTPTPRTLSPATEPEPPSLSAPHAPEPEADPELVALLRERFAFTYPFEHISDLPAKLSVSKLYPTVLDEEDTLSLLPEESDEALDTIFALPEAPTGTASTTAADRGTATHTFLQFCDFDRVRATGVGEELARLTEQRFITADMARLVSIGQLEGFFKSALFARLCQAKRVWREQRFHIFLPAAEFTGDEQKAERLEGETVAVQGVIDLFFTDQDDNLVLCDYKTDFLTDDERADPSLAAKKLIDRHSLQLSYYTRALREICGRAPKEVLIYSLPLGNTVSVPIQ